MPHKTNPPVLGASREAQPADALLAEIHRTVGHVEALGAIVDAIPKDELVEGVTKVVESDGAKGGTRVTTETAPNIWLRLYRDERRHLLDACRAAAACGVQMAAPEEDDDAVSDIATQRAKRLARVAKSSG